MAPVFSFGGGGIGVKVRVEGQERLAAALKALGPKVHGEIARALVTAAIEAQGLAKAAAPVDTGRLRAAIGITLSPDGLSAGIVARSNYAAFMEFGTGRAGASTNVQALPPGYAHGTEHAVSGKALAGWGRRHSIDPFMVAAAIRKRGGLRARPFMGPAFERVRIGLVPKLAAVLAATRKP